MQAAFPLLMLCFFALKKKNDLMKAYVFRHKMVLNDRIRHQESKCDNAVSFRTEIILWIVLKSFSIGVAVSKCV